MDDDARVYTFDRERVRRPRAARSASRHHPAAHLRLVVDLPAAEAEAMRPPVPTGPDDVA